MLYRLKGHFQKAVRGFAGSHMTANHATVLGALCVVLISASFYWGFSKNPWLLLGVPVFSLLRLVMNALDGMLAREQKTATAAGELWNELLDVAGDSVAYGVLILIPEISALAVTLLLVLIWASEFLAVLAKSLPGGRRLQNSWGGGKPERALWLSLMALAIVLCPQWIHWVSVYLLGVSFLVFLTCCARIKKALREAQGKPYESYTPIGR